MIDKDNIETSVDYDVQSKLLVITSRLIVSDGRYASDVVEVKDKVDLSKKCVLEQIYGDILGEMYLLSMYMYEEQVKLNGKAQEKMSEIIKNLQEVINI